MRSQFPHFSRIRCRFHWFRWGGFVVCRCSQVSGRLRCRGHLLLPLLPLLRWRVRRFGEASRLLKGSLFLICVLAQLVLQFINFGQRGRQFLHFLLILWACGRQTCHSPRIFAHNFAQVIGVGTNPQSLSQSFGRRRVLLNSRALLMSHGFVTCVSICFGRYRDMYPYCFPLFKIKFNDLVMMNFL